MHAVTCIHTKHTMPYMQYMQMHILNDKTKHTHIANKLK